VTDPNLDDVPLLVRPPAHTLALAGRLATRTGPPAASPTQGRPGVLTTVPADHSADDPVRIPGGSAQINEPYPANSRVPLRSPVESHGRRATGRRPADWSAVRLIRQQAAQDLAERLRGGTADEAARRRAGHEIVERLVTEHARVQAAGGLPMLDLAEEAQLVGAVMDALFGLGRLQPLVDDEDVENIEITGFDQVRLLLRDGAIVSAEPVADSDEELIDFLQFIASRGSASGAERPFSPSNPRLHLSLAGRGRLAATAWVTARPVIRIRRQTIREVTLADLCSLHSISYPLQRFLEAVMLSRMNVVVSGEPGVGKTTFVRALAAAIPETESLATLESEWELYLDRLPSRALRPVEAFEARPGAGEIGPDGRRSGAISLEELFEDVLRHNVDRIIVGEVRGNEALAMFRAMQAGRGSLSTIHAKNARDTAQRLVTCIAGSGAGADYAWGLVATNIDLIIHLRADSDPSTGRRRRYVSEVIEVRAGEGTISATRPSFSTLFSTPRGTRLALPRTQPTPDLLDELVDAGFDVSLLGLHADSLSGAGR
jgi:pilus assembly protein CpaF